MKIFLAAPLIAILMPAAAQAQTYVPTHALTSGNDFQEMCADQAAFMLACVMFVQGVHDGTKAVDYINEKPTFCLPTNVTTGELQKVALKSLKDHPEVLHWPAGIILVYSWQTAFPCPTQKATK